jgi:hypothetical protein
MSAGCTYSRGTSQDYNKRTKKHVATTMTVDIPSLGDIFNEVSKTGIFLQ